MLVYKVFVYIIIVVVYSLLYGCKVVSMVLLVQLVVDHMLLIRPELKADKRDVGRKGINRVLYSEWTEVLTTHLNGYIQATNSNTA